MHRKSAKKSYDKKNSYNRDKRKRHSFRENQYEGTSLAEEQKYKSLREEIKRDPYGLLTCNYHLKNIRTSNVRNASSDELAVSLRAKYKFFKLLECNLHIISQTFEQYTDLYYTLSDIDHCCLQINQANLAHLMGMDKLDETSPFWKCGFSQWRTLTPLERLLAISENRDLVIDFEKHNTDPKDKNKKKNLLNYDKTIEKNKNLFFVDFFNPQKNDFYAKRMDQRTFDSLYGKHFHKDPDGRDAVCENNDDKKDSDNIHEATNHINSDPIDYIMVEKVYTYENHKRYFSLGFKKCKDSNMYYPFTIIETEKKMLPETCFQSIKLIRKEKEPTMHDLAKEALKRGSKPNPNRHRNENEKVSKSK